MYTDPTGHWYEGEDKNQYSKEARNQIEYYTNKYKEAKSQTSKDWLNKQANLVRIKDKNPIVATVYKIADMFKSNNKKVKSTSNSSKTSNNTSKNNSGPSDPKYNKLAKNSYLGNFYYRDLPNTKALIERDAKWDKENLVYYELPKNLQGLKNFGYAKKLKVNKKALENFEQAFETISKNPELIKQIEVLDPGTSWARHIRNNIKKGISNHSWGGAIDINAPDHDRYINPKKSPNDPNLILWEKAFKPAGFSWGNDYSDSMHYELLGPKK